MNYYAVVFLLRPPKLVRRGPFFERNNVCNSQENGVRTRCAAIVNHPAVLKILRVVNLLRVVFLVRRFRRKGGLVFAVNGARRPRAPPPPPPKKKIPRTHPWPPPLSWKNPPPPPLLGFSVKPPPSPRRKGGAGARGRGEGGRGPIYRENEPPLFRRKMLI